MTTAATAYSELRTLLTNNKPSAVSALAWEGDNAAELPDTPAPFAFGQFDVDDSYIAGFGGGRGSNLYRNPAVFSIFLFVPTGYGNAETMTLAESIATLFRSYRSSNVSCFAATVRPGGAAKNYAPPGLDTEVAGNYEFCLVEILLHFDLIG